MTTIQIGLKKMEDLEFKEHDDRNVDIVIQQITDGNSVLNGVAIVRLYTIFVPTSYAFQLSKPTIYSNFYRNVVFGKIPNNKISWNTNTCYPTGRAWNLNQNNDNGRHASSNPNNQEV
jgi:hypothetical protein